MPSPSPLPFAPILFPPAKRSVAPCSHPLSPRPKGAGIAVMWFWFSLNAQQHPPPWGGFFPFLELFRCLWEFRNLLSGVGESKAVEQKALKKGEKIIPSFFMLFSSEHPEEECYNLSNPRSSLGCFRGALQAR